MTNTQHAEMMAELVAMSRTLQRIADACEEANARLVSPLDPLVSQDALHADARVLSTAGVQALDARLRADATAPGAQRKRDARGKRNGGGRS